MKEFLKINNVFTFDAKTRLINGVNTTCKVLNDIIWEGTEKVDGTNIRVHWDGHEITFAGRTDKAIIPNNLLDELNSIFKVKEMEYIFEELFGEKEVTLYGEGYGPKIQNGETYSNKNNFILFDVEINDYYLSRQDVNGIAERLGLDKVPVVFEGSISDAIQYVSSHEMSTLGNHEHEMEGLVLQPKGVVLYDYKKNPLKFKCKYRDIVKTISDIRYKTLMEDYGFSLFAVINLLNRKQGE